MKIIFLYSLLISWLGLCACQQQSSAPPQTFNTTASIQEIMTSLVDPSADAIWDSVGTTVSAKGTEDREPHTDEEWQQVRRHAIALMESTNLLMMKGRRIVAAGGRMADDGLEGVYSVTEAQKRLESQHEVFSQFAAALHDAGKKMLSAIDEKNPAAMVEVGTAMDDVCESCHLAFWYQKVGP